MRWVLSVGCKGILSQYVGKVVSNANKPIRCTGRLFLVSASRLQKKVREKLHLLE